MDYKNGKIYRIVCSETGEIYYGSTTQPLYKRLSEHKSASKKKILTKKTKATEILDRGQFSIVLVEEYPCDNKNQLERRERFYIENNVCVNKNIPTRTTLEYREVNKEKKAEKSKIYYDSNKEKFAENHKSWCEANKERIVEYKKEYNKTNRESILKNNKQPITCECGCVVTKNGLSQHKKTVKHIELMKLE